MTPEQKRITDDLTASNQFIESGWKQFEFNAITIDEIDEGHIKELKSVYFAGANYLLYVIANQKVIDIGYTIALMQQEMIKYVSTMELSQADPEGHA